MSPEGPPTAEGDFVRTPFPHLLVYMWDRRLSGALSLNEPDGTEHVVRFERGAPVHVTAADGYARFGELLVDAGIVSQRVIDKALATKGLLGDVLILTGHADGESLERMASWQLERRLLRLFGLPPATTFRYFEGPTDGACPGSRTNLMRLIASGLRAYPRCGMPLTRMMERFSELRLALHADAVTDRFSFTDEEHRVLERIASEPPMFVDLLSAEGLDAAVISRVVYVLLLTRQIDLGPRQSPINAEDGPTATAVARMQLRPALHRSGAAAPDLSGDGERAKVLPRTFRRRREIVAPLGGSELPEPPSDMDGSRRTGSGVHPVSEAPEPVSDVHEVYGEGNAGVLEPVSDIVELAPHPAQPSAAGNGSPPRRG